MALPQRIRTRTSAQRYNKRMDEIFEEGRRLNAIQELKSNPIVAEKTLYGYWRVSAIIGGQLVTRQYMGYSKAESIRRFKKEMRSH